MAVHTTDVLVIGAGPTGIGAAVRLREKGVEHIVVDSADRFGGMAASHTDDNGFTWDLGGHVIHSHFPEFDDAVARSRARMREVVRNGAVWMSGDDIKSFIPTPVQAQLESWPTDLEPDKPAANLAEYYRNTFGQRLTDTFFTGYNEKMWTVPLSQVDHQWTSLRSGGKSRNVPQMGLADDFRPNQETFPYPVGGSGTLWSAIVANLADASAFRLGAHVERIEPELHRAHLASGEIIAYRHCISSAPVTWLIDSLPPQAKRDTLQASAQLAIGLGFRGQAPEVLSDKSWIYCPDKSVPWFRATMLSNYDPLNAGQGRWNILLEVTGKNGGPVDPAQAVDECLAGFARIGADLDSIESIWTHRIDRGYPIPTLGRDDILESADEDLRSHDIYSRGRFGGWRYESCNQDYSYMQGRQAVDAIYDGTPEAVYWHPEQF
ncbi:Protoporphyrinogen oxidase [Brevibacterium sp. 239c]|uniref:protoporphyrinogen/coproporphyrinogen oxidase n=1 Tax=Brevibacterium sp. 239c TaxID=1965356 RepID=UPI000C37FF44|nr:NAD(P)-binding protein [Brevibacterium sp. 239c]SMX82185.1 Protoporphyrinogen oxidase [Brevibacterium sp. 239c]